MYQCPRCPIKTLYSETWIRHPNYSGLPSDHCSWCNSKLVEVDKAPERQSALINTRGCTPSSSKFSH